MTFTSQPPDSPSSPPPAQDAAVRNDSSAAARKPRPTESSVPALRLGATTYVYPTGWLDNVRRLAFRVDDIALLFYDAKSPPGDDELRALADVKQRTQLSYTVHLPTDVSITHASWLQRRAALRTLKRLAQRTRSLSPEAYVLRIDGPSEGEKASQERWLKRAKRGLRALQRAGVATEQICLQPSSTRELETVSRIAEATGARLAIDAGRLESEASQWRAQLCAHLSRAGIILWYGHDADERAHRSVSFFPVEDADWLLQTLREQGFDGVLALHVYKTADFDESLSKVESKLGRVTSAAS